MTTAKTKSKQKPVTIVQTTVIKPSASAETDEAPRTSPEVMSVGEKQMLCMMVDAAPELPYPLKPLKMAHGPDEEVYDIPDEDKATVFPEVYPFNPCPALDDLRFDIHSQRLFRFRQAQVIRYKGRNLMVSPYYQRSGGMAVDFLPPECANGESQTCAQEIKE